MPASGLTAVTSWRKFSPKKEDPQTQVATHSSMLEAAVAKSSVLDGEVAGCRRILVLFQHIN